MYTVSIEDTGNHPDSIISKVKECIVSCLKSDPLTIKDLREKLASQLSQPAVMGRCYRFVWVDQLDLKDYFIIIATNLKDRNERSKPVMVWGLRRKEKNTLREICLDVISKRMTSGEKDKIKGLGLPQCLEDSLCEMMEKTCLEKSRIYYTTLLYY